LYNLIVGFLAGRASRERILEYTDDALSSWLAPNSELDLSRVRNLPTLLMPELGDSSSEQVARIGHVEDLSLDRGELRFRFVQSATMPGVGTEWIEQLAGELRIEAWEFNRTHWAVKEVDLYRVLQSATPPPSPGATAFRLPTELPTERDLVAVMMPFSGEFKDVYNALHQAATDVGMRCLRADDIWVNTHIMDDVINLLWRARVVIADLSNKNANVFYETGIAHALGREVIQVTQSMDDVPFDLRSIRTLTYLNNGEGRNDLRMRVGARLSDLTSSR
jgi:hypothetical protein